MHRTQRCSRGVVLCTPRSNEEETNISPPSSPPASGWPVPPPPPPPPPPNISSAWTVLYRYIHCSVDRYFLHSGSSTKGESSRYEGTRMPSEGGGVLPSSSPGLSERRGGLLSALRPPLTWILQTHSLPPEGKLCPFQHSSGGAGCGTLGPACSKVATRWLSCWMAASTAQSHFPPEWKSTRPDADYSCPVVGCGGVVTVNCHCVWATSM